MCILLFEKIKNKKDRGRYALTCIFFFIFTFFFGGVLWAIAQDFFKEKTPTAFVVTGFTVLIAFSLYLIEKLHKKKEMDAFIYDCEVIYREKRVKTQGFWDSGNLAMKNNLPVCFICPSLFYDIFAEDIFKKDGGQVCDEMQIYTLNGVKNMRLYKGELRIKKGKDIHKREVYFSPSKNMLSRVYSLLLPLCIFNE